MYVYYKRRSAAHKGAQLPMKGTQLPTKDVHLPQNLLSYLLGCLLKTIGCLQPTFRCLNKAAGVRTGGMYNFSSSIGGRLPLSYLCLLSIHLYIISLHILSVLNKVKTTLHLKVFRHMSSLIARSYPFRSVTWVMTNYF